MIPENLNKYQVMLDTFTGDSISFFGFWKTFWTTVDDVCVKKFDKIYPKEVYGFDKAYLYDDMFLITLLGIKFILMREQYEKDKVNNTVLSKDEYLTLFNLNNDKVRNNFLQAGYSYYTLLDFLFDTLIIIP